jgi:hypothetical protein
MVGSLSRNAGTKTMKGWELSYGNEIREMDKLQANRF